MRRFRPSGVGADFAGVVEHVGRHVTRFKPGDEVFGAARGAFAEYLTIAETAGVVPKPAGVSFADAGTLGIAGCTALQAVRDHGRMQAGDRVLVNGASGSVGTFSVQIAKALGGHVTAVCSPRNVDMVRRIGADTVIDYTREVFTRGAERYDLIIDVAGSRPMKDCLRVLNKGGAFVAVGASAIQHQKGGLFRTLARLAGIRIASSWSADPSLLIVVAKLRKEDLAFVGDLVASGGVKPVIERTFELADAPAALTLLSEGHAGGKLTVAVRQ